MRISALSILFLLITPFVGGQDQPETAAPAPQAQVPFTKESLEQLVAPVALYPDELLAQVLAASTYPVDIVEAARWLKRNPSFSELSQDDIKAEVKGRKWDPSVKGLIFFPKLLAKLNDNLDWTKELGEAFLNQQKELMDTIQVMRAKAKEAGTLKSDENQTVTTTEDGQVEIQSANPETVYVQNYDPATAYGSSWGYSSWDYPAVIAAPAWPWRPYASGWALGYACGWGRRAVAYNNNYQNGSFYQDNRTNVNINSANKDWVYDKAHAKPITSNSQEIAKRLETERATPRNVKAGDSAAAKELRQAVPAGDRSTAAAQALKKADRSPLAGQGQNASRERQTTANAAQSAAAKRNADPAMSGSRNANLERIYSERGAQSRNVSAKTTNKGGGNVHSRAGAAPKGGGGSRGGGGARGGGGGGGRR